MNIVITGAASGIGECLARIFAEEEKCRLILVDRNAQALEALRESLRTPCTTIAFDLSRIDALGELSEKILKEGPVHTLINNAGIMLVQSFAGMSWEDGKKVLDIDLMSPLRLTQLLLPSMLSAGEGAIVNVASMAAVTPLPGSTYYSAAKAGIGIASEIQRIELKEKNIHVMTVYPGPIATDLEKGARASMRKNLASEIMPTGDRQELAHRIHDGWKRKRDRIVYPETYEIGRLFPAINYLVTEMFSPRAVN